MAQTVKLSPDGLEETFKDWGEFQKWFDKERAVWDWFLKGPANPNNVMMNVKNHIESIKNAMVHQMHNGSFDNLQAVCNLFAQGHVLASASKRGQIVLDVFQHEGDIAGVYAYGLQQGLVSLDGTTNQQAIRGFLLSAIPSLISPTDLDDRLKKERANYRSSLKGAMAQTDEFMSDRRAQWDGDVSRAKALALRYLRKLRNSNQELALRMRGDASKAIASIQETEDLFTQMMGLKAPVDYWRGKAKEHDAAQKIARTKMFRYFAGLIASLAAIFIGAGFIVKAIHDPSGNDPIALYVLISGAVVVLSTIGIWIGRILTKLYLSEHHLKTDAEERAIMTQTYLALTESGHASEDEKNIILTALFRNSSDGIVADDGPPQIGLQTMLAKQLSR